MINLKNIKLSKMLLVIAIFIVSISSADAQSFIGKYDQIKSTKFAEFHQYLKKQQFMEQLADALSKGVKLRSERVTLTLSECGIQNAFYSPELKEITLCHELLAQVSKGIERDFARIATAKEVSQAISGAILFILMHEVGHALIHLLNIPVLGREEDAADQISAYLLLSTPKAPQLLAGSLWFFKAKTIFYTRKHFSDEHSLGPQRQSNLACWAVGKDRTKYKYLLQGGFLTKQRSFRCEKEYTQLDSTIRKLLADTVALPAKLN
jgi:Putative metallopeptidase